MLALFVICAVVHSVAAEARTACSVLQALPTGIAPPTLRLFVAANGRPVAVRVPQTSVRQRDGYFTLYAGVDRSRDATAEAVIAFGWRTRSLATLIADAEHEADRAQNVRHVHMVELSNGCGARELAAMSGAQACSHAASAARSSSFSTWSATSWTASEPADLTQRHLYRLMMNLAFRADIFSRTQKA